MHRDLASMTPQSKKLKAYLVVGASGTIGSAVARKLAESGASIALHYCQNREAVDKLKLSLGQQGARCACIHSALNSAEACAAMLERAYMELGGLDGIALCAGRVPWKSWEETTVSDWQNVMFEHCVIPFLISKLAIRYMKKHGAGSIVYLSSIAAKYGGSPRTIHYASAKAALEVAMQGLSREVADLNIRINGIRAGFVHSPQQMSGRSQQEQVERINKIPMARAGRPEEIAAAMAFLLSDEAGFITTETLTVAGGD